MPHFEGLGGYLWIVARAPAERVAAFARDRDGSMRGCCRRRNSFRRDYGGDNANGEAVPIMMVFKRDPDGAIRLHLASEMVHAPTEPGRTCGTWAFWSRCEPCST